MTKEKSMNTKFKDESGKGARNFDTPTKLSSLTPLAIANELSTAIRDLTAVDLGASVSSVDYCDWPSRSVAFKRPCRITFDFSEMMETESAEKAVVQLQSVSAQQIADLFATRLSKIASEGYEASPKSMRIRTRKGEISGIFSVFVALNGDVQREVLGKL